MSTSLKKLMEQDGGRAVSPAPIGEVLAGGRSRLRRRRILSVAVTAVVALLAIVVPIGLVGDDGTQRPIDRPDRIERHQLEGPWLDQRSLHFRDVTAARPPDWEIDVLTATAYNALYWTSMGGGSVGTVAELDEEGSFRLIGRGVVGVPFADPAGHLVAWQVKSREIVVYDTKIGSQVARRPVGFDATVNAVDGNVVTFTDAGEVFAWRPGEDAPRRVDIDLPDHGFISDLSGELRFVGALDNRSDSYVIDGTGRRVLSFATPAYGEFDRSGRYIALTKLSGDGFDVDGHAIRAVGADHDTELTGYDGDIYQLSWDPSGVLVVSTVERFDGVVNPDDEVSFYACDPATGGCEPIAGSTISADVAPMPANFGTQLFLTQRR